MSYSFGLADGDAAEVLTVGALTGEHVGTVVRNEGGFRDTSESEAPEVCFHAASGTGDGDVTADRSASGGFVDEAELEVGDVGHQDNFVIGGSVAEVVASDGDINLARVVGLRSAKKGLLQGTLRNDHDGVVNAHAVGSGGRDGIELAVDLREHVAGGHLVAVGLHHEAEVDCRLELARQHLKGLEDSASNLLLEGVGLFHSVGVGAVAGLTFPGVADDWAYLPILRAEDTLNVFTHNCFLFLLF